MRWNLHVSVFMLVREKMNSCTIEKSHLNMPRGHSNKNCIVTCYLSWEWQVKIDNQILHTGHNLRIILKVHFLSLLCSFEKDVTFKIII